MLSRSALRCSRHVANSKRAFATSVANMAEGATGSGSSRPGGVAQGDAFSKKEKANEDLYVRQQETQKLKALMQKLQDQKKNIDDLQKDLTDMVEKSQGGKK